MFQMLNNATDRQNQVGVSEPSVAVQISDRSFADSLKRVVRRVLRTQSSRTAFEARVLDEARRILETCEIARESLERLIVDRLIGAQQGVGAFCPPTPLRGSQSTFTPRSAAA